MKSNNSNTWSINSVDVREVGGGGEGGGGEHQGLTQRQGTKLSLSQMSSSC